MAELVDDSEINGHELLWRRIAPEDLRFDPVSGPYCSDGAFRTAQMSVHVASRTSLPSVLKNYPQHSVAEFDVGFVRSIGCIVVSDRTPDDPSHALVCRQDDPTKRLSGSQASRIAKSARLVVVSGIQQ